MRANNNYYAMVFDYLFETSWEVCNKVGGIYTVLSTKAKTLQEQNRDHIIFIGPDVWSEQNPSPYFEECAIKGVTLNDSELPDGITVRIGRWNVPGAPIAILVKFQHLINSERKNALYGEMWERFSVDSLHSYGDYDEGCMFAYSVARVIEALSNKLCKPQSKVIAHFNEWTTGMGLLWLKAHAPQIATIFTTHATSIGRSICGNNKPLYDYLSAYNGDQMAGELNMQSKHSIEKQAAHNADCFTTVSDITATECTELLDITPHVVTPNGFEADFVPKTPQALAAARRKARKVMLNVASKLIGEEMQDDAMILVTSGRHEYRNKGLDLFCDVLNRMRNSNTTGRQIIAFIMVPGWLKGAREDLKANIEGNVNGNRLINPNITHDLHNFYGDEITGRLSQLQLLNNSFDTVKVIYVPCYLDGRDGIFNMTYYELLPGVDITSFASYYEPWGYTPLESIAFGVPTVATTLSGYSQWINNYIGNGFEISGSVIFSRGDNNYWEVVEEISTALLQYAAADDKFIKATRKAAMQTAARASWTNFIKYYNEAFEQALRSVATRKQQTEDTKQVFFG